VQNEKKSPLYSRRSFLSAVGVGCLGTACLGGAVLSVEYLSPNSVLEPSPKFNAGSLDQFSPDSVTEDLEHKIYVMRNRSGAVYAMSAVCTHLGCLTFFKQEEGIIACPCHGSKFTREGDVITGPAPASLPRYYAELNERSQLVIDRSQIVDQNFLLKV
jgi:cytochrome b6-f complex iron-sulfur subunit